MRQTEPRATLIALPIIFVIIIITAVIVAALFLTDILSVGSAVTLQNPTPQPHPTPPSVIDPLITPNPLGMTTFQSTALGIALEYPPTWRKKERTLEAIFSPSANGLDPDNLQDSAIWVGIPSSDTLDHGDLLREILVDFLPNVEILNQETMNLASEHWTALQFSFEGQALGEKGLGIVAVTNKNEVGYFVVAAAPASQWNTMQPTFQQIINSLRFTEGAVLRPTDATPPPTPTPTPTPVIYVVQSGDTLLGIAIEFGVDVDSLAARNGIEVPEQLQTGQKLIIPINRR
jgi:LysM repeat protein